MKSYIDLLQHHSEYAISKNTLVLPNVTFCEDNLHLHYMPVISINNAIVTCDSVIYDGTSHIAENIQVVVNEVTLTNNVDYEVLDNEGWTNVGIYSFTIKGLNANYTGETTGSFIINKAQGEVTTPPTANTLTYNGNALTLLTAGSGTGEMRYSLDGGEWSDTIPTATNAGTYIIGYKALASSNYYESAEGSVAVTIDKVTPTLTAPTANILTYNTEAQELVTAGSTNWGTIKYSTDSSNWSTLIPKATDADNYVVYYMVEGDSNINNISSTPVQVTISPKVVNNPTITISQSQYTYDGTEKEPSVTEVADGEDVIPSSEYNIGYLNNINAGTATVNVSDKPLGNYTVNGSITFTIIKASGDVTTDPVANVLTYDGTAQPLVTAGEGTGTIMYKLNDGEWSSSIPTATNVDTYTVYFKSAESANYEETSQDSINVTISKVTPTVTVPVPNVLTYNKSALELATEGSADFGILQYSLDNSTWSTSMPTAVNGGEYPLYYRVVGDSNVNDVAAESILTAIAELRVSNPTITLDNYTYNYSGSANTPTPTVLDDEGDTINPSEYDVTYLNNINAGTGTVVISDRTAGNYYIEGEALFTINIVAPTYTAPAAKTLYWSGSPQELVTAGITSHGTFEYSTDEINWSSSIPTGTNLGTYTIYWKLVGDSNHENVSSSSLTSTINQAEPVYTAPTAKSLTYTGSAQGLLNEGSTNDGTISYSADNSTWSSTIPTQTNANTYTVYWKLDGDSNHTSIPSTSISVTINKANGSVSTVPTNRAATWNNANQNLINAGSGTGTMYYKVGSGSYSTSIPQAKDVGSYTVYYYAAASDNYNATTETSITATIVKAAGSVSTAPTNRGVAYTGSNQNLVNAGSGTGTMYYKLNSGSWSTSIPQASAVGSYTVYYYAAASTNYELSSTGSLTATIVKASGSVSTAPKNRGVTYNGSNLNLCNAGSGTGTMYYRLGTSGSFTTSIPQAKTVGTYTVLYYAAASTSYNQSSTGSVSCTIVQADGSVSTAPTNRGVTYNGSNQNLVNAGSGTGTMYYRLGTSGSFSTSIPLAKTAGSYTVQYYAAASTNYKLSSTGSVTATIGKANSAVSFSGNGSVDVGSTYTKTLSRTAGDGTITYSSSNTSVATVTNAGVCTGVAAGSCTITGTSGATTNYNSASATYTLTVTKPNINGYEYENLGLSVKWAKCNVGASSETGFGNYFQWGNVTAYSAGMSYSLESETYLTTSGGKLTQNVPTNTTYDAARKFMGSTWRYPTKAEFDELWGNKTNKSKVTINGVVGIKFANKNDSSKYIFLPFAGMIHEDSWNGIATITSNGVNAYYLSSTFIETTYYGPSYYALALLNTDNWAIHSRVDSNSPIYAYAYPLRAVSS